MIFFLKRTAWGLSLISVGENPQAADTAGLPVFRIRYLAAIFNGIMSGIGGAYLTLGQLGVFSENVTSGRGYIALSLVVFGRRHPLGVFFASIFLGAANALQFKMQALGVSMPTQFFTSLGIRGLLWALLAPAALEILARTGLAKVRDEKGDS